MNKITKTISFTALEHILFAVTAGAIIFGSVLQMTRGTDTLIQYMSDDAFYYMELAKNFADGYQWSFDRGISHTTGFHLLFAYILAGVYKMFSPDLIKFIYILQIINLMLTAAVFILIYRIGIKIRQPGFMLIACLAFSGFHFLINVLGGMEWALTLLISLMYWRLLIQKPDDTVFSVLAAFLIGFLGNLSRSDFGLMPFALLVSAVLITLVTKKSDFVKLSLAGFIGACTGLVLMFLHNFLLTGTVQQSSVMVKSHLAEFHPIPISHMSYLLIQTLGLDAFLGNTGFAALLILIAGFLLYCCSQKNWKLTSFDSRHLFVSCSAFITVGLYFMLYLRNANIQPWYSVHFLIPCILILGLVVKFVFLSFSSRLIRFTVQILILAVVAFNIIGIFNTPAPYPHHKKIKEAGEYVKKTFPGQRVGGWNSGILGYFTDGQVVNLDGLVNNSVYPYIISNTLQDYIEETGITIIADFIQMINHPRNRMKGGYDSKEFIDCLTPLLQSDFCGSIEWDYYVIFSYNCGTGKIDGSSS